MSEDMQQPAPAEQNTEDTVPRSQTSTVVVNHDPNRQQPSQQQSLASQFPGLPLDWTQLGQPAGDVPPIRYPHEVAEISKDETYIVIVGTAGQKITHLGDDFSSRCNEDLEELVLRSHVIRKIQGIEKFTKLRLLEFYDNQVVALPSLESVSNSLRTLDMSFNVIRDMKPVACCENLTELYIANNKLKTIEGISTLKNLKKLDLGANRIRVMDGTELSGLVNLEELWLGKNKIESIQGLEKLTKLRRLDVQSNRLTSVENLQSQTETLEELYLAHNGIDDDGASKPTGLAMKFPNLSVLDLGRNRLTSCAPFRHLEALEELWISGNQIATFDQIEPLKQPKSGGSSEATNLETVYLEYNPVAQEFEYRKRLSEWIPSLKQIDATMIGGIAMHGFSNSGAGMSAGDSSIMLGAAPTAEYMRKLQAAAIQRAKLESETKQ